MSESESARGAEAVPANAPADHHPSTTLVQALLRWFRDFFRWKNFRENRSTQVVFGIGTLFLIALKFVIVPTAASQAVSFIAEGHGIDLEVEDWSAGIMDLNASAEKLTIRVPGQYAQAELLTIDEVEMDLSLWRRLRGKGWVNEVRIKGPRLYMERQLNGAWNWQEVIEPLPSAEASATGGPGVGPRGGDTVRASFEDNRDRDEQETLFNLPELRIEDMRLEWVENLPGDSGGGLINEQRATLFLDDMEISAKDLMGLMDPRAQPSRFTLNARTADGKISVAGQANFFAWSQRLPGKGGVMNTASRPLWAPSFNLKLYLENVGAGAFARLTPEVAVRPARGTMSGSVELALHNYELTCKADIEVRDVTFAVNRSSPLMARRGNQVEREVSQLRPVNGRYQFGCGGLGTEAGFRPVQAFQSRVTREALREAPATTRAAAAADHTRYTTEPLDPAYRVTVANMVIGVDADLLELMDVAHSVSRTRRTLLDRLRGLPGLRR